MIMVEQKKHFSYYKNRAYLLYIGCALCENSEARDSAISDDSGYNNREHSTGGYG